MIGHAKFTSSLYFLQQPTTHQRHLISSPSVLSEAYNPFNKRVCHVSADVWHMRLGHPSLSKLQFLKNII